MTTFGPKNLVILVGTLTKNLKIRTKTTKENMLGLELKKKSAIHKNQNVIYILHFIQTTLNINCELVILNSFTGVVMALTGFVLMMLVVSFTFLFFIL
mgnify:CR=1 FL=1